MFIRRLLLLVMVAVLAACTRQPQELVLSGPTMGTTYTIKVVGAPRTLSPNAVQEAVDGVLASVDADLSIYREDSAISRFNANEYTDWIEVPGSLATVVAAAQTVSRQSGGALDITIAPLIAAWGFGPTGEPAQLPAPGVIEALRERMGYERLEVRTEPPALRKQHPKLAIDVNAVAPGYAVDLLAKRIEALGLRDFMIDIGGEVLARGKNARGEAWRIAVERPIDAEPRAFKIVQLDDRSVTTSGEYRHFFERDGERFSHTLDPRSGQPIRGFGSVCVVGESSLVVDAWATALNVLGPEEGLQVAEREGLAAMYVIAVDGALSARSSSRFQREVITTDPK